MLLDLVFCTYTDTDTSGFRAYRVSHTRKPIVSHWYIANTWSINRSKYLFKHVCVHRIFVGTSERNGFFQIILLFVPFEANWLRVRMYVHRWLCVEFARERSQWEPEWWRLCAVPCMPCQATSECVFVCNIFHLCVFFMVNTWSMPTQNVFCTAKKNM